ncbi:MAG: hypothetical protein ACKO6F_01615 [Cyanobium sp.]
MSRFPLPFDAARLRRSLRARPALLRSAYRSAATWLAGRRPPLPLTAGAILLLLLVPLVALQRWPRSPAEGLEKLLRTSSLLQSFPGTPDRPVPQLWQERLPGLLAQGLWRQQRRSWWQFWGIHSDVPPYLALPATGPLSGPPASLPPNAMRVDDLVVIAPDPLSLRLLRDRLLPQQRRSRGLQGRCVERLRRGQAVFWNPAALGVILESVAPLLQDFQEGCLALDLDPLGLRWQGEAASVEGMLLPLPSTTPLVDVPLQPPLPANLLLEVEGDSLGRLLKGLLSRQLIREPLASRYGLDRPRLELLRSSPFRLRLLPLKQGPFQASLELQVKVGRRRDAWKALLTQLAASLRREGLLDPAERSAQPKTPPNAPPRTQPENQHPSSQPAAPQAPPAASQTPTARSAAAPLQRNDGSRADWSREDGVVVGGWRWVQSVEGQEEVLFFLGPPPPLALPIGTATLPPGREEIRLRARPAALAALGLLPLQMPQLVQRSEQLWMEAAPLPGLGPGQPVSRLTGRLQVPR